MNLNLESVLMSLKMEPAVLFSKSCALLCKAPDKHEPLLDSSDCDFLTLVSGSSDDRCRLVIMRPFMSATGKYGWIDQFSSVVANKENPLFWNSRWRHLRDGMVVAFRRLR